MQRFSLRHLDNNLYFVTAFGLIEYHLAIHDSIGIVFDFGARLIYVRSLVFWLMVPYLELNLGFISCSFHMASISSWTNPHSLIYIVI